VFCEVRIGDGPVYRQTGQRQLSDLASAREEDYLPLDLRITLNATAIRGNLDEELADPVIA
jgi:hypothetical protein